MIADRRDVVVAVEARAVDAIPRGSEWQYEPKWDGFRALIFRDGDEVVINSRGGKDLARYFPEIVDAARAELPDKVVLDGEIGVPALIGEMGRAYPELSRAETLITETLDLEERRFRRTLERGLGLLDEATREMKAGDMLDGETAFTLYDTYGFPLDLTQDALRNRGINVDIASFTDAMDRQRAKARASWARPWRAPTGAERREGHPPAPPN